MTTLTLDQRELRNALNLTTACADFDGKRPSLMGIRFAPEGDTLTISGADGIKLARWNVHAPAWPQSADAPEPVSIDARALARIRSKLSAAVACGRAYLSYEEDARYATLDYGKASADLEIVQGRYPSFDPYLADVPEMYGIGVHADDLVDALKACDCSHGYARMWLTKDRVLLVVRSDGRTESIYSLDATTRHNGRAMTIDDAPWWIGINVSNLLPIARALRDAHKESQVVMTMQSQSDAIRILCDQTPARIALMPVHFAESPTLRDCIDQLLPGESPTQ